MARVARTAGLALAVALASLTIQIDAQKWVVPRTADGRPDLEGVWENNSATPLERPRQLADKPRLSDEELESMKRRAATLFGPDAEATFGDALYQTLLAKYGPQGVAGFNWNEAQSLFLQGKAAMWLDGIGFAQPLEDPTKSRIVGKVGYGVMPAGPKAQVSAMFGDGEGISASSKKQGPAWFYLQWASNKTNQFRMLQAASGAPVRNSAYIAAQSSADIKAPKQWIECMLTSARIAQPGLPLIVPVTEFRDVFGIALTNMINGADPASEMKKATAEFQPVLDKSEKA